MKNIAKFMLLPLFFMAILLIKPTYAYWASSTTPTMFMTTTNISIGEWVMPLDVEYEYDPGDLFSYNDQIWEVVDVGDPVGPNETRMLVIVPGEGLVLVAITGDGNGNTIVVRIN